MERAEHAYNFAALESRWGKYMRENAMTDANERRDFLTRTFVEEQEIAQQKQAAKKTIQDVIKDMETDLIAKGVKDESERLRIILAQL